MKKIVCLIMIIALAFLPMLSEAKDIRLTSSTIHGTVLYMDGETPIEGVKVVLWSMKTEKRIYSTETDEYGGFAVPKTEQGDFILRIGDIPIDMGIMTARGNVKPQEHSFVLLMPKRQPLTTILIPSSVEFLALPYIMSP